MHRQTGRGSGRAVRRASGAPTGGRSAPGLRTLNRSRVNRRTEDDDDDEDYSIGLNGGIVYGPGPVGCPADFHAGHPAMCAPDQFSKDMRLSGNHLITNWALRFSAQDASLCPAAMGRSSP